MKLCHILGAIENGERRRSSQILCDGAKIWVTKNCKLALLYLFEESSKRLLWVDTICINQKDNKEGVIRLG